GENPKSPANRPIIRRFAPRGPIVGAGLAVRAAKAPSARRFDAQALAGAELSRDLPGKRDAIDQIASGGARSAPFGPAWAVAAALGDQREGELGKRLDLSNHAVAAAVAPGAAGAATKRVFDHAQREFALERLDRGVQGVAHRHVNATRTIAVG